MKSYLKASVSIAALAIILASQANAADPYQRDGSIKDGTDVPHHENAARSWTGLWLGAVGGYQMDIGKLTSEQKHLNELGEVLASQKFEVDGLGAEGFFGEVQLGFDKQIGTRIVVGVFGGLNITDAEFSVDTSQSIGPNSTSVNILSAEKEWGGVLGGRLGYLPSQNTMIYIAGGWAFGEISQITSAGVNVFENQETDLSGFFGEAGMETRLSGDLYLKAAVRYTDYGSINLEKFGSEFCPGSTDLEINELAGMVGLTYKLNVGLPGIAD